MPRSDTELMPSPRSTRPFTKRHPFMVIAYSRAGRRTEAIQLVQKLASLNPPQESIFMAQAYATLGENEAALAWLTRSVDARERVPSG